MPLPIEAWQELARESGAPSAEAVEQAAFELYEFVMLHQSYGEKQFSVAPGDRRVLSRASAAGMIELPNVLFRPAVGSPVEKALGSALSDLLPPAA